MNQQIDLPVLESAVEAVRSWRPDARPRCGIVLGSGWSEVAADLEGDILPYAEIPGLGQAGVMGHPGSLLATKFNGMDTLIFQGRRHWYEGEGWTPVVLPMYLLKALGADTVLLTNAAGGIREDLKPGSLMVIEDHINMIGTNPLIGPHSPKLGPRFPDQSEVYDTLLRQQLLDCGADASGIYVATSGPSFETPAEINLFRSIGADAVGMSTVPEAIIANALQLRVAGLSCICNWAAGIHQTELTHEDVNQVASETMPGMKKTITAFLESIANEAC